MAVYGETSGVELKESQRCSLSAPIRFSVSLGALIGGLSHIIPPIAPARVPSVGLDHKININIGDLTGDTDPPGRSLDSPSEGHTAKVNANPPVPGSDRIETQATGRKEP